MNDSDVYVKTAAGEKALLERSMVLDRQHRTLLIMVDGKTSVAGLCETVGTSDTVFTGLSDLEKSGFVKVIESESQDPDPSDGVSDLVRPIEGNQNVPDPDAVVNWQMPEGVRSKAEEEKAALLAPELPIRRPGHPLRWIGLFLLVLALSPVVALLFYPYQGHKPAFEKALSELAGQSVDIASISGQLFPRPGIVVQGVKTGASESSRVILYPQWTTLMSSRVVLDRVDIQGARWQPAMLAGLVKSDRLGEKVLVTQIVFSDLRVIGAEAVFNGLGGTWNPQEKSGQLENADGKFSLRWSRNEAGKTGVEIVASNWGWRENLVLDSFQARGVLEPHGIEFSEFGGAMFGGGVDGRVTLIFDQGARLRGEVKFTRLSLEALQGGMGLPVALGGFAGGSASFSASGPSWSDAFSNLVMNGDFSVERSRLRGFDLSQALKTPDGAQITGSETLADLFKGRWVWGRGRFDVQDLKIQSGLMHASGNLSVTEGGRELEGWVHLELRGTVSSLAATARLSGSLAKPQLFRQ